MWSTIWWWSESEHWGRPSFGRGSGGGTTYESNYDGQENPGNVSWRHGFQERVLRFRAHCCYNRLTCRRDSPESDRSSKVARILYSNGGVDSPRDLLLHVDHDC